MMKNNMRRNGMTLVISGPSGSGKSTLYKAVSGKLGGMGFSVSCTTRSPRPGEQDGVDYYFLTKEDFERRVAAGDFAEYACVHGNYYGTLKSELSSRMEQGMDVVLDIDVQGAMQLRTLAEKDPLFRDSLEFVFVAPPSYAELEKRLRGRGTESAESLEKRLHNAREEMTYMGKYDYLILNDVLEDAVAAFEALIRSLRLSVKRIKLEDFQ